MFCSKTKKKPFSEMKFKINHSVALFSIFLFVCTHGSINGEHLSNQTDYLSLLEFKQKIKNDPNGFFKSWNDSHHFCKWEGIFCGHKHQRVIGLNVSGEDIFGTISPYIGNLSFLRVIYMPRNNFHGQIPQEISRLLHLRILMLSNNTLKGRVPVNLSRCSDLKFLFLSRNQLVGSIPEELGSLKKLKTLALRKNYFTGFIPRSFGNLSSLTGFDMADNNVQGTIPNKVGQLTNLFLFDVSFNHLSGIFPSSFYNISAIEFFYVTDNQLTGTFPSDIGFKLPNLQELACEGNNFHGEIPVSFSNASYLQFLSLGRNKLTGKVPAELGYWEHIRVLNLEFNLLGSNASNDLSFITSLSNCTSLELLYLHVNNFGGEIPSSIWNLSAQLQQLLLGENHITGTIPPVHENHSNLDLLYLSYNLLSGSIPTSFENLKNLQELRIDYNKLSGQIPSSLGNISQLYKLYLAGNDLEGSIPEIIGDCEHLETLDLSENRLIGSIPKKIFGTSSQILVLNLSGNSLSGSLPIEVGNLKHAYNLDISNNNFTGNIPGSVGDCSNLEYLFMQGNFFQGVIPSSLTAVKGIVELDLSRNNLSGQIPEDIAELRFLSYLNLSFNNFEGEVPNSGVFKNATIVSVLGNSKLCGGIKDLELRSCIIHVNKPRLSRAMKMVTIAIGAVLLFILIISFCLSRRKSRLRPTSLDSAVRNLLRVSYQELYRATQGFSPSNLIGSGSFGSVYQGKLNQEEDKLVAVKVLNLENTRASKSFLAECRALRNIRHKNLVKILTYCSSIDSKRNQFMALVYEFMENGNLDMWLHPQVLESSRSLRLLERVNVAVDVANAIHYLHDLCEPSIIHCDLKPSNILLDNELSAHVGDFGLARLVFKSIDTFAQEQSSSTGINGSIGYAAPEYGTGGRATKYGDVYSYGVLLLEMIMGMRPTDEIFKDDLNLHNYVKTALEEQRVMMIVDATLVATGGSITEDDEHEKYVHKIEVGGSSEECIIRILKIGVACSADSPTERMCMSQVLMELRHIKTKFLGE